MKNKCIQSIQFNSILLINTYCPPQLRKQTPMEFEALSFFCNYYFKNWFIFANFNFTYATGRTVECRKVPKSSLLGVFQYSPTIECTFPLSDWRGVECDS